MATGKVRFEPTLRLRLFRRFLPHLVNVFNISRTFAHHFFLTQAYFLHKNTSVTRGRGSSFLKNNATRFCPRGLLALVPKKINRLAPGFGLRFGSSWFRKTGEIAAPFRGFRETRSRPKWPEDGTQDRLSILRRLLSVCQNAIYSAILSQLYTRYVFREKPLWPLF
jgi:hypothetical protein